MILPSLLNFNMIKKEYRKREECVNVGSGIAIKNITKLIIFIHSLCYQNQTSYLPSQRKKRSLILTSPQAKALKINFGRSGWENDLTIITTTNKIVDQVIQKCNWTNRMLESKDSESKKRNKISVR